VSDAHTELQRALFLLYVHLQKLSGCGAILNFSKTKDAATCTLAAEQFSCTAMHLTHTT
jgi:hypothetical protein